MALSRREFVRLMAALGLTPTAAQLAACSDDVDDRIDTGGDIGSDGGTDADAAGDIGDADAAGDLSDAGSDLDADTDTGADADAGPDATSDADTGDADVFDTSDFGGPDPDAEPLDVPSDLPEYTHEGEPGPETLFSSGVASGDPWPDAVILWTHVSPDDAEGSVELFWEIATDAAFTRRLQVGTVTADASAGFTVKVDVTGLAPGRTYFYRFNSLGRTSPIGRTRTAPVGDVRRLRFAVVSCQKYTSGYYHAYASIAERADLDAVIHLGDYIYEGGPPGSGDVAERLHDPPRTLRTLDDYRARYRNYRSDPDLQEAHRQHPFINVWDDHESMNNAWRDGAGSFTGTPEEWAERKAIAWQAMMEWLPIRPTGVDLKIWRRFSFGDLADLVMLDTRIWDRDEPADNGSPEMADPTRSILGEEQAAWLDDQLCESTAAWRVIGQQVMMAHLYVGTALVNSDQWDGYPGSRARFLQTLVDCEVDDVVVLTGDIHSSWANDLATAPLDPEVYDPETGAGALAVEMVCSSVSSGVEGFNDFVEGIVRRSNPHMKWIDLQDRGYLLLDLSPERAQGAWFLFEDVREPDRATAGEYFASAWATQRGANHLVEHRRPAPAKLGAPPLAP